MIEKKTISGFLFDVINYLILFLLVIVTLYPILHVLFASFSDGSQLAAHKGFMFKPEGFSLEAYAAVFKNRQIYIGYKNTLLIIVGGLALSLTLTSMGAYFLSRENIMLQRYISFFIVFTMFLNGGLIPTYLTVKSLGLRNNLLAMFVPCAVNTYNLMIMRTAFYGLPKSLEESAKLDGANDFQVLFRIFIPISMPVVAVMILYYGLSYWNSWFAAMIYFSDRDLYPLQLILRELLVDESVTALNSAATAEDTNGVAETIKYATIIVSTVPVLCVYPFLQKYFAKGVLIGAVKG